MYWGSMVLSWLAQFPHSKKVQCSNPALAFMSLHVLSWYSSFLPPRITGESKCECEWVSLSVSGCMN